ncbi:MAG: putative Ig domain-containing protein [Chloroflexi bacterium]|nr:putative Ig domain-containing protein [Chloroflexota bacterium]
MRPGRPFVHLVPVADGGASRIRVEGLPAGLSFDAATRVISGRARARGEHAVTVSGEDANGPWSGQLELLVGGDICLTPPLGWNSWNCFGPAVSEEAVRQAALVLVGSGLAALGWSTINIDDGWQGDRDRRGRLQPNAKFRDLGALCADLHAMGLRAGIYSSPGPTTCAGFGGSAGHEAEDAASFAAWGFDYLKYDWCSAGPIDDETPIDRLVEPFGRMRNALDRVNRDFVYHVSEYGFGKVWEWARERAGANAWRTTGDIDDTWGSVDGIGFGQDDLAAFAGPGGWNDPDMLVVGRVGGAWNRSIRASRLTLDEQRTHFGLWALLGAPLLLGCDLSELETDVLAIVANEEILAAHQDVLGLQARRRHVRGAVETWEKPMADGSTVVGVFNRGPAPTQAAVDWGDIDIAPPGTVRDLWARRSIEASAGWQETLPAHGSAIVRVWPGRLGAETRVSEAVGGS